MLLLAAKDGSMLSIQTFRSLDLEFEKDQKGCFILKFTPVPRWGTSLSIDTDFNITRSSSPLSVINKINEAEGLQVFLVPYTMLFSSNVSKSTSGLLYWSTCKF